MFYSCVQSPVIIEVNMRASKHTKLIVNAAFCLGFRFGFSFNIYVPVVVKGKAPNNFLYLGVHNFVEQLPVLQ